MLGPLHMNLLKEAQRSETRRCSVLWQSWRFAILACRRIDNRPSRAAVLFSNTSFCQAQSSLLLFFAAGCPVKHSSCSQDRQHHSSSAYSDGAHSFSAASYFLFVTNTAVQVLRTFLVLICILSCSVLFAFLPRERTAFYLSGLQLGSTLRVFPSLCVHPRVSMEDDTARTLEMRGGPLFLVRDLTEYFEGQAITCPFLFSQRASSAGDKKQAVGQCVRARTGPNQCRGRAMSGHRREPGDGRGRPCFGREQWVNEPARR
jgi:hypothetical protein